MPSKVWVVGEEVLAADFNDYVQEQVVATFPNAGARTAALAAPKVGMLTWLDSVGRFEYWNGSTWRPYGTGGELANYTHEGGTGNFATYPGGNVLPQTLTVDVPASRILNIRFFGILACTAGTGIVSLAIKRAGGGAQLAQANYPIANAQQTTANLVARTTGIGGTQSFEVWGWVQAGLFAFISANATGTPALFTVTDVGGT